MQVEGLIIGAIKRAMEEMNATSYSVPAGSMDEYSKRIGKYSGLKMALDIIETIIKERDDE